MIIKIRHIKNLWNTAETTIKRKFTSLNAQKKQRMKSQCFKYLISKNLEKEQQIKPKERKGKKQTNVKAQIN